MIGVEEGWSRVTVVLGTVAMEGVVLWSLW